MMVVALKHVIFNRHLADVRVLSAFKSCWEDCIYEMNACERHHNVVIMGGTLEN